VAEESRAPLRPFQKRECREMWPGHPLSRPFQHVAIRPRRSAGHAHSVRPRRRSVVYRIRREAGRVLAPRKVAHSPTLCSSRRRRLAIVFMASALRLAPLSARCRLRRFRPSANTRLHFFGNPSVHCGNGGGSQRRRVRDAVEPRWGYFHLRGQAECRRDGRRLEDAGWLPCGCRRGPPVSRPEMKTWPRPVQPVRDRAALESGGSAQDHGREKAARAMPIGSLAAATRIGSLFLRCQ
jgi:hypothetical protein